MKVFDAERDINKAKAGSGSELVYKNITGLTADLTVESKPTLVKSESAEESEGNYNYSTSVLYLVEPINWLYPNLFVDEDEENSEDSDSSDIENDEGSGFKDSARPRDESPDSKKLRKKAVKDAKAEKRKQKMKKHMKKRKEKQGTKKK